MSKIVQTLSHTTHDDTDKSHAVKQSIQNTKTNVNSITGYENNIGDHLEQLEREAEKQVQQIELSQCLEFVAQLVDLFKHTVITSELQNQNDWCSDTRNHLQQHKTVSSNRVLDNKVEKIVINKGLTKEHWSCLLYMALSTPDTIQITKVSKQHLHKVHDMALRLLDDDEQNAAIALIHAIEKFMSNKYFTEK